MGNHSHIPFHLINALERIPKPFALLLPTVVQTFATGSVLSEFFENLRFSTSAFPLGALGVVVAFLVAVPEILKTP